MVRTEFNMVQGPDHAAQGSAGSPISDLVAKGIRGERSKVRPAWVALCDWQHNQLFRGDSKVDRSSLCPETCRPRRRYGTIKVESVRDACAKEGSGHRSEAHAAAAESWLPTGGDGFTGVDSGLTGQGGEHRLLWARCHPNVIRGLPRIRRWVWVLTLLR